MTQAAAARHRKVSKFLSRVLRHQPQSIGLELEAQGWADIEDLVARAGTHGMALTREEILQVVAASDKQRFALDASVRRIRANQGHSIDVDLALGPREPPPVLFHGTAETSIAAIRAEGLRPGGRQHVHLSVDAATATAVGQRHGRPVVLRVAAGRMRSAGLVFYLSANGVWLTDAVPPEFIELPEPEPRGGNDPCAPPS
jgi:putative RNA 2'-phosphotransferase